MLKELTAEQKNWVETTLASLSTDEKILQMVCERYPYIAESGDPRGWLKQYPVGSVYVGSEVIDRDNSTSKQLKEEAGIIFDGAKVPIFGVSDFEQGVGGQLKDDPYTYFPEAMAVAAAGNIDDAYTMGKVTALEAGTLGVHGTFGTVTDLAMGKDNPITLIRSFGSRPEKTIPFLKAHIRGLQEHGCAACAKHFPGDGVDNRNQHFVTSFNPLTKEEWLKTYGKVWKEVIDEGVMTIMVGHIAMPELEGMDPVRQKYRPATVSKAIMTDLLRGELGYRGLIITDALGMNGFCSWADYDERMIDCFNAGADLFLWPETERFLQVIRAALAGGRVSMERLEDGARHVLELKARLDFQLGPKAYSGNGKDTALKIAQNALNLLRNVNQALPLKRKDGAKYCVMVTPSNPKAMEVLKPFVDELQKYGTVDYALFKDLDEEKIGSYDAVFLLNIARARYTDCRGWEPQIWPFLKADTDSKRIVVGFANPFFLYDVPSCDAFINAYSPHPESQRCAVRACFGEMDFHGKSPIDIPYFINAGDGLTLSDSI